MVGTPAFDAVLLLSFGGPNARGEVIPFLENVTRGRDVPRERLEKVAGHYYEFGGKSPINGQNLAFVAALEAELARRGPALPVYWGNRNWGPFLMDTLAQMRDDGIKRAVAFATSAYSSYSSCRQYLENIEVARAKVGDGAPLIEKIRPYWNHPGFIEANAAHLREAAERLTAPPTAEKARVLFTAHSIPLAMAATCSYETELREASRLVAARAAPALGYDLVFQSRSGPPQVPWLEPDILGHMETLPAAGVSQIIVAPVGFVSDHMEVVYDLDREAAHAAGRLGLEMVRASTVGTNPRFVGAIRDLIVDHIEGRPGESIGGFAASRWPCARECCAYTPRAAGKPRASD